MDKKDKNRINPLLIKDANTIMFHLTINISIMLIALNCFEESRITNFIIYTSYACVILGLLFGIIICIGWIVAIATKQVIFVDKNNKKDNNNGNDNLKFS